MPSMETSSTSRSAVASSGSAASVVPVLCVTSVVPAAEPGLAQSELTELAEAELLVEEVSIDGMCGVY